MCTVITKNRQGKPSIAKEDIIVYKACDKDIIKENVVISPSQYYKYMKDTLNEAIFSYNTDDSVSDDIEGEYEESLSKNKRCYVVHGFHSYLNKERMNTWSGTNVNCKFIVPKGALYYKNAVDNIVSNQIIFKEIL